MPDPIFREEVPLTLSRLRWAIKLRVGLDTEDILGLAQSASDLTLSAFSELVTQNLQDVGSVEQLEVIQNKSLVERRVFGANPVQAFQIVPQSLSVTLRASKVALKIFQKPEKDLNFYPTNLVHQQMPFLIQATDIGNPRDGGASLTEHFFFGCWFADTRMKWDVVDKADQRLIQDATIKCARMFTLDQSNAGDPATIALQNVFGGIIASGENQDLIDDLELF